MSDPIVFSDRRDAGRQLAQRLANLPMESPAVLALADGGIPVGYEIARALGAPLDVLIVQTLQAQGAAGFQLGAIAPGGVLFLEQRFIRMLGLSQETLQEIVQDAHEEMELTIRRYGGTGLPDLRGRTAIVTNDGLTGGNTILAAIEAVRKRKPDRIVLAMPVCAPETAEKVGAYVDDIICASTPQRFRMLALWYEHFNPLPDVEALALLEEARGMVATNDLTE